MDITYGCSRDIYNYQNSDKNIWYSSVIFGNVWGIWLLMCFLDTALLVLIFFVDILDVAFYWQIFIIVEVFLSYYGDSFKCGY